MKNIVVGFGTPEHGTRALEWAAKVAKRSGSKVIVVNIFHGSFAEMSPEIHEELVDERRRQVSKALSDLGHADYEIVIQKGEAVQLLLGYSLKIGADLIVVGQQDSMAHGGFGEGGAFEGLLRSSTIPFVVVSDSAPLPSDDGPFRMIVGVDGSEANADSVNGIGRIAKDLNAVTFPVLSVNTMASTTRDHYGSRLLHQDEAEAIASRLPNAEQLRTINESPVAGLIDAAEDIDADLIAIGTRGHRGFSDFFAGQLTRHVVEHSERAVLVSPHG